MRFLKRKVCLKQEISDDESDSDLASRNRNEDISPAESMISGCKDLKGIQGQTLPLGCPLPFPEGKSKNIVKNYGKAMCTFASSTVALPHLQKILIKNKWHNVQIACFMTYIHSQKNEITSIDSLRRLLVEDRENDNTETVLYKKIFKEISVIFLKFYAVNWIYGGKLLHKKAHMRCRFKLLRRVQCPENFTYLH